MKMIDRIRKWFVLTAAIAVTASLYVHHADAYGPGDTFRINLQLGCGPSGPGTPLDSDGYWSDVGDWQIFLKTHGETLYLGGSYPTDMFDQNTETATADWQRKNSLPQTGIVDQATFNKSLLLNPTTSGPPWKILDQDRFRHDKDKDKYARDKHERTDSALKCYQDPSTDPHNSFRIPLGMHETLPDGSTGSPDTPGGPGGANPNDPNGVWNDVLNWQNFLKCWELSHSKDAKPPHQWMDTKYPNGTFDQNTEWATMDFQQAVGLPVTGAVDFDPVANTGTYSSATKPITNVNTNPMPAYPPVKHPGF